MFLTTFIHADSNEMSKDLIQPIDHARCLETTEVAKKEQLPYIFAFLQWVARYQMLTLW